MNEPAVNETQNQPPESGEELPVKAAEDVMEEAAAVAEEAPKQSVGQRLAAEREAREWTVGYVASQLNLAPRQIQALEADNYSALPGLVSVRGFVRSYAKLLKIDANPLVATIGEQQPTPVVQLEPKQGLAAMPLSKNLPVTVGRRSVPGAVVIAAALALVVLLVLVLGWRGSWSTVSQSLPAQVHELASASSGANDAAAEAPPTLPLTVASAPETERNAAAADEQPVAAAKVAAVSDAKPAGHPAASAGDAQRQPAGKNPLVFTANEDSWVEVKAGNNTLFSHLIKSGSTESVDVSEPVVLTIGNAAGVDVTFRGNPLDVKTDAKSNVTHLNLK
ncbi:MAG: helix-turn-helix domain-containing protein [Burkholderiaceae bacterium]|nr:helix-turn-helix domain-containing protein [Burkholderiaceae bacterium]